MDDIRRIRGLLEVYETALQEIRDLHDPALDELQARLEAREAAAAHDYFEQLQHAETISRTSAWPTRHHRAKTAR